MLDQSLTTPNLRIIYDQENRKGIDLANRYFPDVVAINSDLRNERLNLRQLRKNKSHYSASSFQTKYTGYRESIKSIEERRDTLITNKLEIISDIISRGKFQIVLKAAMGPYAKPVYTVQSDANSFFAIKQVQSNINRFYKVKQSNRSAITSQLRAILSDGFPKFVIRTDISKFYESIPRRTLLSKIDRNSYLSQSSIRVIRRILSEYGKQAGSPIGLPRGIGLSAYLAELFMGPVDEIIRSHKDVTFYSRYVDDILVVFTPPPGSDLTQYSKFVSTALTEADLDPNPTKTEAFDLTLRQHSSFTYLGYLYSVNEDGLEIRMSRARYRRYRRRLYLTFRDYDNNRHRNEPRARTLLCQRIRFLTGNTRLLSAKKAARVGVYFNNAHITTLCDLSRLDESLRRYTSLLGSSSLMRRLKNYSFYSGFCEQRFSRYKLAELASISSIWRHV